MTCKNVVSNPVRNSSLDVLKCLAAYCVICIHCQTNLIQPLIRWAVPFFFMVTGYYYPSIVAKGRFSIYLRKLVILAVCSSVLYAVYPLFHSLRNGTFHDWTQIYLAPNKLALWLVCNEDLFGYHLWYFWAIIYDLVILRLVDKFGCYKYFKYIIPLLLLAFFIASFTPLYARFRTFLFWGLPCITIGRWIRENRRLNIITFIIEKPKYILLWVAVTLSLCYVEVYLHKIIAGNGASDMYIFTLPALLPVFYSSLQDKLFPNFKLLATIGRDYSAYIYILHIIVLNVICDAIGYEEMSLIERHVIVPLLTFIGSLCLSYILRMCVLSINNNISTLKPR